ncbi:MAG: hypothetical protein V4696_04225 [Pseudomonadota bacterium]
MIAHFLAYALAAAALAVQTPAPLTVAPLTVASARQSMVGQWQGKLEYRDYQADKWFGLPVKTRVDDGGDGVTQIRLSDFDDGPKVGNVRITTVSMLEGTTETGATFRKGRKPDLSTATLALSPDSRDATHWTLAETSTGTDNDRPATLRLTTTRDGAKVVTLKEVDFTDDTKVEWLVRNRTTLERVGE